MTPAELAEIRALCDAATPGEWKATDDRTERVCNGNCGAPFTYRDGSATGLVERHGGCLTVANAELGDGASDARFIAASRQLVPRLVDALEAARDALEAARDRERNVSRLLDARTAGPWAHDPPGSGTVVSTVYRGRVVAQCDRLEDADAIARSYEEWPAALERARAARVERDNSRDDFDKLIAAHRENITYLSKLEADIRQAYETCRVAVSEREMLDAAHRNEKRGRNAAITRIAELERMLTAWQKHRHSPSLLSDWTRYMKEKP